MKRSMKWLGLVVIAVLVAPHALADVKTREKSTMKFEGLMGGILTRMLGGGGDTSTIAVKGNRMSMMNDSTGQIIDLSEEKIYLLDVKKKEYRVLTFAEMRKQMEDAKKSLQQQSENMKPEEKQALSDAGKQLEFDADAKETGQKKNVAGQDTRQVILTIVMREKGRTLEEGGGLVMTNDMWLAERVPAMDELHAFYVKYFKAVFEGTFSGIDAQQANAVGAFLPGFAALSERMAAESKKLQGTAVMNTMTIEGVKSAEQMKAAASQQQQSRGGGITGAIAGGLMRGRGGAPQQRTKALTTTRELLSVGTTVADADVQIPKDFKERK
jgi:hypothetical protein